MYLTKSNRFRVFDTPLSQLLQCRLFCSILLPSFNALRHPIAHCIPGYLCSHGSLVADQALTLPLTVDRNRSTGMYQARRPL
jgi:hypothetical protein